MDAREAKDISLTEDARSVIESGSVLTSLRVGVTGHRVLDERIGRWLEPQLDDLFSFLASLPPRCILRPLS